MNIFRNSKFEVDVAGKGELLFAVYDYLLCRKLNKVLRTYGDYVHQPGEEGQFRVASFGTLIQILATPPFKGIGAGPVEEMKKVLKV